MKTELEYKEELLLNLRKDCLDFADRDGTPWTWEDMADFLIRRGWRNARVETPTQGR